MPKFWHIAAVWFVLWAANAMSQSVTLSWNGASDPAIQGFYVYYGTNSGIYFNKIDVATNTSYTATGLIPGLTYYFSVTAYGSPGVESDFTPEITYIVPGILVMAPGGNGGVCIQFPVEPGHYYELQSSIDLVTWCDVWVTSIQTSNAWIESDQPCGAGVPAQFFRLVIH